MTFNIPIKACFWNKKYIFTVSKKHETNKKRLFYWISKKTKCKIISYFKLDKNRFILAINIILYY